MPLFPATKLLDPVMGLDFHAVSIPPVPVVPMEPHPYFGPLLIWLSPTFPKTTWSRATPRSRARPTPT